MVPECPRCGDPVAAGYMNEPGIEQYAPCGCRVATDGGETGGRSVDDTDEVCRVCEEEKDEMGWTQFADGSDGWICDPCEERILDEHGIAYDGTAGQSTREADR